MTNIDDFNRIDDCDKIDASCINAFVDFHLDPDNPTGLCLETSWGGDCLDLTSIVKEAETCTSLYLSPEEDPNCLVFEGECDNYCIHGDDLSRIISMQYLKDVDQSKPPMDGDVYIYNGTTKMFEPFDLKTTIQNINTTIQNINQTLVNHGNRLTIIEEMLTPPADAPENVRVVFGNINDYSDPNVVINENTGAIEQLDKTHGLYTHLLADNAYGDEIFG